MGVVGAVLEAHPEVTMPVLSAMCLLAHTAASLSATVILYLVFDIATAVPPTSCSLYLLQSYPPPYVPSHGLPVLGL